MSVDDGVDLGSSMAVLASLVRQIEQLEVALHHRTIIGQAQGILMQQLDIDADTAFEHLKRVSSHTNTKLVVVADSVVHTRRLPDD